MDIRKANDFFGYALFTVGILKIVLIILIFLYVGINITTLFSGGEVSNFYYGTLATIVGFAQIILAIASIIMIIINLKKDKDVVIGYVLGLAAIILEIITPTLFTIFVVFVECGLYIKAGNKIRKKDYFYKEGPSQKTTKKIIEDTDWFYSDKK